MKTTIGQRIRAAREAAGLSRVKLARPLGCDPDTLANWEAGRTAPTTTDLVALATALSVTAASLLTGEK